MNSRDRLAKKQLEYEILHNLRQIYVRAFFVLPKLFTRYFFNKNKRTPKPSYSEYDNYWDKFREDRDIFRTDLPFTRFDLPIDPLTIPM